MENESEDEEDEKYKPKNFLIKTPLLI